MFICSFVDELKLFSYSFCDVVLFSLLYKVYDYLLELILVIAVLLFYGDLISDSCSFTNKSWAPFSSIWISGNLKERLGEKKEVVVAEWSKSKDEESLWGLFPYYPIEFLRIFKLVNDITGEAKLFEIFKKGLTLLFFFGFKLKFYFISKSNKTVPLWFVV